jgi:CheY-like chemotaxis protein
MIIDSIKKYNWEGKKALVVEDDPSAAFLLSEILKHTSMQVETVNSGLEAVEKCKTDPDIDVVLLDLQIPGISGFEAATQIKQIRKDLPIIAQFNAFDLLSAINHFLDTGDLPFL